MFTKSLRAALAVAVVTCSMGLYNMPRAYAIDWAQANCLWSAQAAYNQRNSQIDAKDKGDPLDHALDDTQSIVTYNSAKAHCRMTGGNVSSFPYRSRF